MPMIKTPNYELDFLELNKDYYLLAITTADGVYKIDFPFGSRAQQAIYGMQGFLLSSHIARQERIEGAENTLIEFLKFLYQQPHSTYGDLLQMIQENAFFQSKVCSQDLRPLRVARASSDEQIEPEILTPSQRKVYIDLLRAQEGSATFSMALIPDAVLIQRYHSQGKIYNTSQTPQPNELAIGSAASAVAAVRMSQTATPIELTEPLDEVNEEMAEAQPVVQPQPQPQVQAAAAANPLKRAYSPTVFKSVAQRGEECKEEEHKKRRTKAPSR